MNNSSTNPNIDLFLENMNSFKEFLGKEHIIIYIVL